MIQTKLPFYQVQRVVRLSIFVLHTWRTYTLNALMFMIFCIHLPFLAFKSFLWAGNSYNMWRSESRQHFTNLSFSFRFLSCDAGIMLIKLIRSLNSLIITKANYLQENKIPTLFKKISMESHQAPQKPTMLHMLHGKRAAHCLNLLLPINQIQLPI